MSTSTGTSTLPVLQPAKPRRSHPFKGRPVRRAPGVTWRKVGHNGLIVGQRFKDRHQVSEAGGHAPLTAGISGSHEDGCYSIVLNNGYKDDKDEGENITYTGAGGRDRKRNWSGHQARDQEWKGVNKYLTKSNLLKNPIRVFRGPRCKSPWGPGEGYKYDGLYRIVNAERIPGENGKMTCRCYLERLQDQPPLLKGGDPIPAVYTPWQPRPEPAASTSGVLPTPSPEPSPSDSSPSTEPSPARSRPTSSTVHKKRTRESTNSSPVSHKRTRTDVDIPALDLPDLYTSDLIPPIQLKVEEEETKPTFL